MSKTDPGALADSISDGSPIDWDDVEKSAGSAEERHELKRLFHVHRIAEFNRGLQRSTVEAAAGPADAAFPALSSRRTAPRDVGQWGPLTLVEKLGEGATGEVWRAWEERLQRDVALKLMKPSDRPEESTRRLLEEGSHLARIRHDGVARVYGIETHDGRIGLWMELLDGEPLDRIVQQRGPFSPGETLLIGAALCRALAAVHGAGLLHRDVKAQNVIRTDGGRIVLTDFGLGSPLSAGTASMRPDAGVPLSGTPMYMAPEVLAGEPASIASEIFSLGVLLYYAVSGQYPIEARSLSELSAARIAGRSRPLRDRRPDLPVRFIEAVDRALSLEPARRYRSAGEMETALLSALKESGEPVSEPRSSGRRGFAPGIFAALVFLAIAAGVFLISRRRPAGPETASVSYDVEASFVRLEGEHETPLLSGERVAPGDRLGLDLRATRPLYIYVLNEDEQGESYLLFPQAVYDRKNPIPAGAGVRLPGSIQGAETAWKVTSPGVHEYLLVVASPDPLKDLEKDLASIPAPETGRAVTSGPVHLAKPLGEILRGVGGLETVRKPAGAGRMADVVRRLGGRETGVSGIWIRKVVFNNPR